MKPPTASGELVSSYLEFQRGQLRDRSYVEVERYLDRYAKPLHGLPAMAVDRKRIADLLDTIAKEHGSISANRARTNLSALFAWAMRKGLHDQNPVIATEKRKEKSRHRVLTDPELATVWNTLGEGDYADIVRLLILTGQRASEIGDLHWSEIDFDRDLISLPAERTKNARPHDVPMSGSVRDILKARPRSDARDLVFGFGAGGFSGWGSPRSGSTKRLRTNSVSRFRIGRSMIYGGRPQPGWLISVRARTLSKRSLIM